MAVPAYRSEFHAGHPAQLGVLADRMSGSHSDVGGFQHQESAEAKYKPERVRDGKIRRLA
jgi:hypothetical protein